MTCKGVHGLDWTSSGQIFTSKIYVKSWLESKLDLFNFFFNMIWPVLIIKFHDPTLTQLIQNYKKNNILIYKKMNNIFKIYINLSYLIIIQYHTY